jgi:hypothetical protein
MLFEWLVTRLPPYPPKSNRTGRRKRDTAPVAVAVAVAA